MQHSRYLECTGRCPLFGCWRYCSNRLILDPRLGTIGIWVCQAPSMAGIPIIREMRYCPYPYARQLQVWFRTGAATQATIGPGTTLDEHTHGWGWNFLKNIEVVRKKRKLTRSLRLSLTVVVILPFYGGRWDLFRRDRTAEVCRTSRTAVRNRILFCWPFVQQQIGKLKKWKKREANFTYPVAQRA